MVICGLAREKYDRLRELLKGSSPLAVAFSGGVDSSFLAKTAVKVLRQQVFAVFVDTPFVSRRERESARRVAGEIGIDLETIAFDPLSIPEIRRNPVNRCYLCKRETFGRIVKRAGELGCKAVADGSHAGDSAGFRPGKKALEELGIVSPLAQVGLLKDEIRELSRLAGLSTWGTPSQSCLATRAPYGARLSRRLLARIEAAEDFLHDIGCSPVRARCERDTIRIEVEPASFQTIIEHRERVLARFQELGFRRATLDLAGFRSGSWDETPAAGAKG